MIILIVSYGTSFSGVCLMKDNSVLSCKIENEVSSYFPKETAEEVLSECGVDITEVDDVVFLGKPFSYLERIINTHIALLPRSFLKFFFDIRDFFSNKLRIKAIAKGSLNFQNDICYIELTDAIAWQISKEYPLLQDITIIVFLRDCLSSRVGGRYQKKEGSLFLNKELCFINPINNERSSEEMKNGLKELLSFERCPQDDKIILASTYSFSPDFKEELLGKTESLYFRLLSDSEIFEYAGRYALEGVNKWR